MSEILDEDYTNPTKETVDKRRRYIRNRTIIYLAVMVIAGLLCGYQYLKDSADSTINHMIAFSIILMLFALGIEFFYQLFKLLIHVTQLALEHLILNLSIR